MPNLRIETKRIYSWEAKQKCNDCDNTSIGWVKFPKFKPISVCGECFDKYYKHQIQRSKYV